MAEPIRHILLSGTMRSGTTLMCSMLNAHPQISIVSDLLNWFWKRCFGRYGEMNCEYELERAIFELEPYIFHGLREDQKALFRNGTIRRETVRKGLSYLSFYEALIEHLYTGELGRVRGVKVTHCERYYSTFLETLPDAFVIHMVRDCRDTYYSHKNRVHPNESWRGTAKKFLRAAGTRFASRLLLPSSAYRAYTTGVRLMEPYIFRHPIKIIDEWALTNEIALLIRDRHPGRIAIVKFEDLIADTEEIVKELILRTELEWMPGFYDYGNLRDRSNRPFEANTSFQNQKIRGYSKKRIASSTGKLSREELAYYQNTAHESAKKLGYP
jgi:hypothetical protein